MPLLRVEDADGTLHIARFTDTAEIRIGADADWSTLCLPAALGVAPQHAIITRAALSRLPLLIDRAGSGTWVNDHPVVRLRVLRQGDVIRLGRAQLTVWEVQIRRLGSDDPAVGQKCPVSRRKLQPGDEVIACPGCGAVHLRDAWFLVQHCAAGCGYPNREVILETLPAEVPVERALDADSRLVERIENGRVIQEGQRCRAGQARDQVPFQPGQHVAFCPACQAPFHLECFLTLTVCPACQYPIRALIDRACLAESEA